MPPTLKEDLARLDELAFHRREYCEPEIRRYHALRRAEHPLGRELQPLYNWLFVPISLWPFNIQDVFATGA